MKNLVFYTKRKPLIVVRIDQMVRELVLNQIVFRKFGRVVMIYKVLNFGLVSRIVDSVAWFTFESLVLFCV